MVLVSLTVGIIAAGCATDDTIDRTFDPCAFDVDAATTPGMPDALAMWNLAPAPGAPRIEIVFEDAAPSFHGHYDDEHGIVYINAKITDPRALSIVLAHELGHAFGLEHRGDGVMARGNVSVAPTAADRALIASCR